ncbi:hypothetical protein MNB_SV-6-1464 [hydrothermal vent metagenome]|uniref:Uncharacterized protein n=1 Tax=hydrothermal vent metagenome TaxID=652676 RepID=A0A1W1BCI2_9ZZZZ
MKTIKLLWSTTLLATIVNADISMMDYLCRHAIGSKSGEKVTLSAESRECKDTEPISIDRQPPPKRKPHHTSTHTSIKLQECYDDAQKLYKKFIKSNKNNNPSENISIVTMDASKECSQIYKECADRAWQAGRRCFDAKHQGLTPAQIANRCNTISGKGAIKCALLENQCSYKTKIAKCKTKYANETDTPDIPKSTNHTSKNIDDTNSQNSTENSDYTDEKKENIELYRNDIEILKDRLDRARARLRAELEVGVKDRYHKQRIEIYRDSIKMIEMELKNSKQQLQTLGGQEKAHIPRNNSDVYSDIEFNRAIHNEQQELRAKQKIMRDTRFIINRFGDDPETKRATIKKIDELSKNSSLERLKRIKSAVKKQYYDAWVAEQESETIKQQEIDKELSISENRTILIRDTAATINKTLGLAYGNVAGVVATVHGMTNNAVDAVYKDKEAGAVVSIIKDMVDSYTFKLGGELIDIPFRLYKYYHGGVDVPSGMRVYDKNGNLLTRVKSGDELYDIHKNRINYSFVRRLERYKLWTTKARDDVLHGDINKKANGFLDAIDNGKKLGELLWLL